MTTLFHYVHCPFCVRVRMALGLLKTSYKSVVLPYNDEETPLGLTGVKMLPIVETNIDGESKAMNESLDIIKLFDKDNTLKHELLEDEKVRKNINDLLDAIAGPVHNLVMPYWIYTKEFNEESRAYFQAKKEKKRGPFNDLAKRSPEFLDELNKVLNGLENKLQPFYNSSELTILDIMLASHLWGLYVYPEFQFPPYLHNYLQSIKRKCAFDYHQDFWSGYLGD